MTKIIQHPALILAKTRKQQFIEDCETHGVLFNFKDDKGNLKTGIVRKGQYKEENFKNGWLPRTWRRMTRRERRTL